jgi:hypothetical protein
VLHLLGLQLVPQSQLSSAADAWQRKASSHIDGNAARKQVHSLLRLSCSGLRTRHTSMQGMSDHLLMPQWLATQYSAI